MDNSWVVPYSTHLLRMFACHINVEICISREGAIKYLFKYVCKGHDRLTIHLKPNNEKVYDEIKNYQDARYLGSPEAVYRMLEYDIIEAKPSVTPLEVHLPGKQRVYFKEGEEQAAAHRPMPGTKLTMWFDVNIKYPNARHLKYDEFPSCFTWVRGEKKWSPRVSMRVKKIPRANHKKEVENPDNYRFETNLKECVGRMYTVSPKEGERYYLRLMLTQIPGAMCFEDLRTVEGTVYGSFKSAAKAMGLLKDDIEWKKAIREAFSLCFVPLTHLFATILAYCEPSDPFDIWYSEKDRFIEDFRLRHRSFKTELENDDVVVSYALMEVVEFLKTVNISSKITLEEHGIFIPHPNLPPLERVRREREEMEKMKKTFIESFPKFNGDQKRAFNKIVGTVISGLTTSSIEIDNDEIRIRDYEDFEITPQKKCFMVDASGGTGKTFLLNAIISFLKLQGKKVIVVASSGVAATLLIDGATAHSTFKIPLDITSTSTCNVSVETALARKFLDADVIIWDEIVMMHKHCLEAVDRLMKDVCQNVQPFGGKTVVLSGDFRQILPVIPGGSKSQVITSCFKFSKLYSCVETVTLSENMRLKALHDDPNADEEALKYPEFLLKVGEGRIPGTEDGYDRIMLPPSIKHVKEFQQLIDITFAGIQQNYKDVDWLASRVILTLRNRRLPVINAAVAKLIPGRAVSLLSADTVTKDADENALRYPTEFLNSLSAGSLPDHKITLKKGFIVMLLRNINTPQGHCNGTRYIVEDITPRLLSLSVASGKEKGKKFLLPRIPCGPGTDHFPVQDFSRLQFPIRVCFGVTTNKGQGQSFGGKIGLDLTDDCFAHGQLFVGLSRTTDPRNVTALTHKFNTVRNVVYHEVFLK